MIAHQGRNLQFKLRLDQRYYDSEKSSWKKWTFYSKKGRYLLVLMHWSSVISVRKCSRLTCDVSGKEVGRPHLSGSHSIELLKAKPEMLIFVGLLLTSVLVENKLLSLLKSFKIQPSTFDEWQIGPSSTTLFLFSDSTATGQVPNTLKYWLRRH